MATACAVLTTDAVLATAQFGAVEPKSESGACGAGRTGELRLTDALPCRGIALAVIVAKLYHAEAAAAIARWTIKPIQASTLSCSGLAIVANAAQCATAR